MQAARGTDIPASGEPIKRRSCSKRERRRIVEKSLEPGASVAVIARSHGRRRQPGVPLASFIARICSA